ncbi:hypothetical protein DDK00_24110 [Mycobacteroides abscessus]|uniref:Uncharacterized protein n=4 Tax=Mycobacteroides abscessus TaxID=36809 RepID=B1MNJ8_MYCA9|nr:hypothetical protein [Mycobacteroides abscessus]QPO17496.1 membrane protein [Mycobacterium phage phiGD23-1]QPO17616.1 hypothetical protein PHIGD22-1_33 [Mycobacterium phage phiGD22-1]QPO17798.1 hypothetical protein PROPHIGD20-1_31 [Mycobacterium phage phiGD20-1]QSM01780.1 hypothetical protein PROPHIGD11-1_115 [Mycobacterium phage prophiGD11-1]QSM02176.1 hypothetical protein PROPHIGD20-1_129 [Mycobacterium phage prophiGD20-1]QSM02524.1 hypothetical protein PROPHIGD17-2_113 [Mycobacterium ph
MTAGQWFGTVLMIVFGVWFVGFNILLWVGDRIDKRNRAELADISRDFDALGPNPSLEEMQPALDRLAAYRIRFENWRSPTSNPT